ncbi:hypothetical protein DPMN_162886 [Dreissena polymorpha]|uniref:Uncharacterized protein n=1 Tax=Dreissena polymorpha TaxID=45954 RepID=A0A9D4EVK2_DREPO|nr:hypothetical protein DPMN_162886 [Dreissena polymorpha]
MATSESADSRESREYLWTFGKPGKPNPIPVQFHITYYNSKRYNRRPSRKEVTDLTDPHIGRRPLNKAKTPWLNDSVGAEAGHTEPAALGQPTTKAITEQRKITSNEPSRKHRNLEGPNNVIPVDTNPTSGTVSDNVKPDHLEIRKNEPSWGAPSP